MRRPTTGQLTAAGKERTFPLRGRITRLLCDCCIARLLVFATEGPGQPVLLRVDSNGGKIDHALNLISTMNGVHTPIGTYVGTVVEGSAIAIAAHGTRGARAAHPNARYSFKALAQELDAGAHDAAALKVLKEHLARDTHHSVGEVERWLSRGVEFDSRQALEAGFVDQISTSPVWPSGG